MSILGHCDVIGIYTAFQKKCFSNISNWETYYFFFFKKHSLSHHLGCCKKEINF